MDIMRGPPPAPGQNMGAMNQPPPTPPRPAIPPKPGKEKIQGSIISRSHSITDTPSLSPTPGHPHTVRSPQGIGSALTRGGDVNSNDQRSFHDANNATSTSPIPKSSSSSAVLNPSSRTGTNINQISPGSGKPALPPKPTVSSPPSSARPQNKPSPLKFPPQSQNVDNAKFANDNSISPQPSVLNGTTTNGSILHSPPAFLRAKPPPRPEPISPRGLFPSNHSSRPTSSSSFNFSSPIQNLNSANFPSTSNGLNKSGIVVGGLTSPTRLAEIRQKSASLGRNPLFPPPASESGGGIRGIISRKSATLSKFLPLDLHVGSGSRIVSPTKPKPNSLNLNPFIIQQKQQQQQSQMSQQQVLTFGKSINFSPESPLPPPPPPRLKKKLSPVNSLGSPSSPTSPISPVGMSGLASFTSLPQPPPISPNLSAMQSLSEAGEPGVAIYAEVNKEKKWADRKMKEDHKPKPSLDSYSYPTTALNRPHKSEETPFPPQRSQISNSSQENPNTKIDDNDKDDDDNALSTEILKTDENDTGNNAIESPKIPVVDSWLGKYLNNNPITTKNSSQENDQVRSVIPTYQSAKTGHIYETIGEGMDKNHDGILNNNNNNEEDSSKSNRKLEEENLGENQSFLFKLVIGKAKPATNAEYDPTETPTKDEADSKEKKEEDLILNPDPESKTETKTQDVPAQEEKSVSEPEAIPPPPPPRLHQRNSLPGNRPSSSSNTYLIPTVVQDIGDKGESTEAKRSPTEIGTEPEVAPENVLDSSIDSATPSRTSSILRRRSWNCGRTDSPTPSECSSVTSSNSYVPYRHRVERSSNCTDKDRRDSLLSRESWIDEGDLSNGVLADAESSDVPPVSSAEDIAQLKGKGEVSPKSFASRRNRLVNSIFGSFGKGSSSSSGGTSNKRFSGVRNSGGAGGKRGKEKCHSTSIIDSRSKLSHQSSNVSKWGRQVSDSILSTAIISGPIVSNNNGEKSPPTQKSPSVQFSTEVSQTRIIYHDQDSSEDGANPEVCITSPNENTVPALEEPKDDESVSSSESVSVCGSGSGSISGFEDILADLSPKEKKSFYVAREILTSERTFVDVLNLLTIEFPKAISVANKFHGIPVISDEELQGILGGLTNLKKVNEDLLSDLEERVSKWKESPKIADILVKKGPFLKLYASYIKDFQKNSLSLDTCRQKYPLFAQAMKEFELSERCQKLGLKHYMLKPVQRMPQYRLLLEDYLKSLDADSEDYEDTVKGIAIVKDVAEHANEAIRLQVNAEKLLDLQNRLPAGTIILKSDRQLMKDGELDKVCRKELQPRFFALMNDCLLCFVYHAAAGSPKDLKLRYELPLAGMRVSLSPAEDYRNEFSVISVTRSFNLVAKTSKDRDEWMKALNSAIHDNIKKRTCSTPDLEIEFQLGKEAPVWIQDSRVTMCQLCTAEFTVTFRRHHCRACGKVVCGNCSGNQAPLKYLQNASSRVCDSCYEYLLEDFDKHAASSPNDSDKDRALLREKFKKVTPNVTKRATKIKRTVPSRLEVNANSSGARISGYLNWKEKEKKNYKRRWFVLIDRVLYVYAASEDIVAIKSVPLLGWEVEMDNTEPSETDENQAIFRLKHLGQQPIHFQADSMTTAEKWVTAMSEAVVL